MKYASNILYFNISTEIEGRETTINCENEYVKNQKNLIQKETLCNYIIKTEKFAKKKAYK